MEGGEGEECVRKTKEKKKKSILLLQTSILTTGSLAGDGH
jgi:hypothetical protein